MIFKFPRSFDIRPLHYVPFSCTQNQTTHTHVVTLSKSLSDSKKTLVQLTELVVFTLSDFFFYFVVRSDSKQMKWHWYMLFKDNKCILINWIELNFDG